MILESLSDAKICLTLCPTSSKGWFWKAKAEAQLNELENALESYQKCLELDEESTFRSAAIGIAQLIIPWCSKQSLAVGCKETVDTVFAKQMFLSKRSEELDADDLKFFIDALHVTCDSSVQNDSANILINEMRLHMVINIGMCLSKLRRLPEAVMCYYAALGMLYSLDTANVVVEEMIQSSLGKNYLEMKMLKQSKVCLEKALQMQQEQKNCDSQAFTHSLLGKLNFQGDQYEDAIMHYQQSNRLINSENRELILPNAKALACCYYAIGPLEKAAEYYKKAIEQAKALTNFKEAGKCLCLLGTTYATDNRCHLAEECFLESARVDASVLNQALQLRSLGMLKYEAAFAPTGGSINKAMLKISCDNYRQALALAEMASAEGTGTPIEVAVIKSELSRVLIQCDMKANFVEAVGLSRSAVQLCKDQGTRKYVLWICLYNYGWCTIVSVVYAGQNIDQAARSAIAILSEAESIFETVWNDLQLDQSMIFLETGTQMRDITRWIHLAFILCKEYEKAYIALEVKRSKALVRKLMANPSPSALGRVITEPSWRDSQAYARLLESIFVFFARLDKFRYVAWIISGDQSASSSFAFINSNKQVVENDATAISSQSESDVLRSITAELCKHPPGNFFVRNTECFDLSATVASGFDDYNTEQMKDMHNIWWKPIEDKLGQHNNTRNRVIICPDGDAWNIPFALITNGSGRRLIEDYTMSIAPSISTLKLIDCYSNAMKDKKCHRLVVGNPAMPHLFSLEQRNVHLCQLWEAEVEVIEVAKQLSTTALCGKSASKNTILDLMQISESAHFATHGFLTRMRSDSCLPGGLVLSSACSEGETDSIETCCLLSEEIQQMDLSGMRLAVLSCCHSGGGDIKQEGLTGLARAFLYAECQCVIVARWKVPDLETRLLMNAFYSHYLKTSDAPSALREAQLFRAKQGAAPSSWGAWYVFGHNPKTAHSDSQLS